MENKVMKRLKEHYNYLIDKGHEVVFVAHQGSYNYGLEYEHSDIDSKAVILPTFSDFVEGKSPFSHTYVLDNEEHIDTKDIRVMCDMWKKENISYIELLYTKYIIINPEYQTFVNKLLENRDKIVEINKNQFLRCLSGMSKEKVKALCHPYPATKDKIDKWGFDGKQLSHLLRLNEFIHRYTDGVSIEKCYISLMPNMLINIKQNLNANGKGYMPLDVAKHMAESYDKDTAKIKNKFLNPTDTINDFGLNLLYETKCGLLKQYFKKVLQNT